MQHSSVGQRTQTSWGGPTLRTQCMAVLAAASLQLLLQLLLRIHAWLCLLLLCCSSQRSDAHLASWSLTKLF